MGVRMELDDLPPRYREQAERQIFEQKRQRNGKNVRKTGKSVNGVGEVCQKVSGATTAR